MTKSMKSLLNINFSLKVNNFLAMEGLTTFALKVLSLDSISITNMPNHVFYTVNIC